MAPQFGDEAGAFREQVASAEVVDRINTVVGFYTKVKVDRASCSPVRLRHQGAHFQVEGTEHGIGIILWDQAGDGYLETIEGWTVDEGLLERADLANLKFVRLTNLG